MTRMRANMVSRGGVQCRSCGVKGKWGEMAGINRTVTYNHHENQDRIVVVILCFSFASHHELNTWAGSLQARLDSQVCRIANFWQVVNSPVVRKLKLVDAQYTTHVAVPAKPPRLLSRVVQCEVVHQLHFSGCQVRAKCNFKLCRIEREFGKIKCLLERSFANPSLEGHPAPDVHLHPEPLADGENFACDIVHLKNTHARSDDGMSEVWRGGRGGFRAYMGSTGGTSAPQLEAAIPSSNQTVDPKDRVTLYSAARLGAPTKVRSTGALQ